MSYKKIMLSILTSVIVCQSVMPADNINTVKDSIKSASNRAFWGWTKARTLPFAAGAAMATIPPLVALLGFMGAASHYEGNANRANNCAGVMLGGGLLSCVSIPAGMMLMSRQGFLVKRDLGLLHKFTSSTAHLDTNNLPTATAINQMNNHHQLLNGARNYFNATGNMAERRAVDTWGFRGYKKSA